MVIIALLLLSLVVIAFAARGAPKPKYEQLPAPEKTDIKHPQEHPWSSGVPGDADDFAGPNGVYGPGTKDPD